MEKQSVQTTYTENECSMLRYVYDCVFFVARKPADVHFNCQEDDQQQISPPAAKSPRREGTNSLTWQKRWTQDYMKIKLTKRKWTLEKKIQWTWIFFLPYIFFIMHLMELRALFCFLGQAEHQTQAVECNTKYCSTLSWISSEKHVEVHCISWYWGCHDEFLLTAVLLILIFIDSNCPTVCF